MDLQVQPTLDNPDTIEYTIDMSKMLESLQVGSFGYLKSPISIERLKNALKRENALLVDTKFSPKSKNPTWRKESLVSVLERRYIHLPQFGNSAYKSDRIVIADMPKGIEFLVQLREFGFQKFILMCACANESTCHRNVIIRELLFNGAERVEFSVKDQSQLELWS